MKIVFFLLVIVAIVSAEVYFDDDFTSGNWEDRWVVSTHKGDSAGEWVLSAGEFYGDAEKDKGLKTSQDARFYQISAEMKEFSNKGKDLVLQYSVKHEQNIDCGGAYIKTLPAGLDQEDFGGDSDYNIMFGPDICGSSTKRVHVILNYNGENHLIKKSVPCETDEHLHVYTLIIRPDQTYAVLIDNEEKASGDFEDWDFLPSKQIKDPSVSKPSDWVDEQEIPDPEDVKPSDWDDVAEMIEDPDAEQPEDWDEELDGEWEAPMIPNPDYNGEWTPRMIPNPDYKGEWVHPEIDNPDYKYDSEIYAFDSHKYLGIEVWQVKAGTIFDDFLVTDDVQLASDHAVEILARAAIAREAFDAHEAEEAARREAERKEAEEAAAAAAASEDDDEDDDEDEELDEEEFEDLEG